MRQVAQAMVEQLKEDEQELKTREQRRKAKDAKRIRGIVHENGRNEGASRMTRWCNSCTTMRRNCSVWKAGIGTKYGRLDPELCAKARREEVEYFRRPQHV